MMDIRHPPSQSAPGRDSRFSVLFRAAVAGTFQNRNRKCRNPTPFSACDFSRIGYTHSKPRFARCDPQSKAIFLPEDLMADSYLNSLLGDKEKIILEDHQHWLVLLGEIATELILSAAIILLSIGLAVFIGPLALLGLLILLAPVASLTRDVLIWSNRKYVITNRRVIQISGVLNKDVVDSSLEKVNDVMLDQSFWGRIFGYGDLEILTASEIGVNKIRRIANPVQYKIAMVNAKAQLEGTAAAPSAGSDVPALISQLDALRQKGVITDAEFQEKKAKLMAKI
jgi:hypothetical protein